jgi:hypothetical protein
MADERFTVETARAAAAEDRLDQWMARFLASPGSDNAPLGQMLGERGLLWIGPIELPISRLNRLAGPPGHPVVVEVDDEEWRDDISDLEEKVEDGWEPPPVVVTYDDGQLKLEDGNHRVEGMRRAGEATAWAVVGFETAEERDRFIASAA